MVWVQRMTGQITAAAKAKADAELEALIPEQAALADAARNLPDPLPPASEPRRTAEERRDTARSAQAMTAEAMDAHEPSRAADRAGEAAKAE